MTDHDSIDLAAIEALRSLSPGDGGEFLKEITEIYLQDTPERLVELEAALQKMDTALLVRTAHSIKGSSSNFGATRLSSLAHEIEMQGKAGNVSAAAPLVAQLNAEYSIVAGILSDLIKPA